MERRGEHMERRGEHMERRGEHMGRHVGIARGRPHVSRGWREWRQSSRDGGALLPRRRRLRTSRGRMRIMMRIRAALFVLLSLLIYVWHDVLGAAFLDPPPHSGYTNDRAQSILLFGLLKPPHPHRVTTVFGAGSACTRLFGIGVYDAVATSRCSPPPPSRGAGKAAAQLSAPAPSSVESRASGGAICHSRRKAAAPPGQLRASAPMAPRNSL